MDKIYTGLNPAQLSAVTHRGSPLLVLAGAGSGKTRVLTHRAAFFVTEHQIPSDQIVLLTFTNKAAGEMKLRMNHLLPGSKGAPVGVLAGTFHSFCCRILRHHIHYLGFSPSFTIYDSDDQENLIRQVLSELDLNTKEFKPSSLIYFIENQKNSFISPKQASDRASGFFESYAAKVYQKYQQKLAKFQALDFNDLLFQTVKLFTTCPEVLDFYQQKYTHFLIDEYQDTNQIQYQLTKLLCLKNRQITAVGDASQAIYGWRGADYRNLNSFTADFSDTTVINLEENYRSTNTILSAANQIISKNNSHPILTLFTKKNTNSKIKIFEADSEISEALYVASQIDLLSKNLAVPFSDMAVLYRTNAQSRVIEEAFLKQDIPYVLIGGLRFYDRSEIKDVIAMLRLVVNPSDDLSWGRLEKSLGKKRRQLFKQFLDSYESKKHTSLQAMESAIKASGYLEKFDPKDEDDQRRLDNIKELKSVASAHLKLDDFLENVTLVQQEYSLQEKNKKKENRHGVRLMTLHSSKGLEFEVVFIVGLEEGILPHSRSMIEDTNIEEERRLCYVGITRAKEFLYLTYATRRLFYGKSSLNEPSRFISDISKDLTILDAPENFVRNFRPQTRPDSEFTYDADIY